MMISRREFVLGGTAGAVLAGWGNSVVETRGPLTFLAIADVHYRPGIFPHDNVDWLQRLLQRAVDEKAAFVVQLGDFVHAAKRDRAYIDIFNDGPCPAYHVVGNHDDDGGSHTETLEAYRLKKAWYRFDVGGFRFLVLDTNYACLEGRYIHYGCGAGFVPWKLPPEARMHLTDEQLEWLKSELEISPLPCVLCAHRRLDAGGGDSLRFTALVDAVNKAHPGRVRLVLNGHNHCDSLRVKDGVAWYTVNSPNYCWVPKNHGAYPAEDVKRWREINHVIAYDVPVSALITLHPSGRIVIKGEEGRFWRNITPQVAGCSSQITPSIISRDLNPLRKITL